MKVLTSVDTASETIDKLYEYNKNHPKSYIISTFGCQMNEHDSEKMSGLMETMGFVQAETEETADVILFNTCAVRENAELRVLGNIGRVKTLKEKRPGIILGVCGCMMQEAVMRERIRTKYPYVDLVFGTHNFNELPWFLSKVIFEKTRVIEVKEDAELVEGLPVKRHLEVKAFVNIMQGCDNFCSYCIVPYTRGREKSREVNDILEEILDLVKQGVKEVTLLGQNVNSYGKNLTPSIDFAELLKQVSQIEGLMRIRFMTSHPKDLTERLMDAFLLPKVMPSIHLPAQSGSDRILKAMNRKYSRANYLQKVERLREKLPGIAITTDLIIGFPGETENDVDDTISLIDLVRYDAAFTFIYSKREGTPAAKIEDSTTDETKHKRFERMLEVLNTIVIEKNRTREGLIYEVLIDAYDEEKNVFLGRTPENFLVSLSSTQEILGTLQKVRITRTKKYSLEGELLWN